MYDIQKKKLLLHFNNNNNLILLILFINKVNLFCNYNVSEKLYVYLQIALLSIWYKNINSRMEPEATKPTKPTWGMNKWMTTTCIPERSSFSFCVEGLFKKDFITKIIKKNGRYLWISVWEESSHKEHKIQRSFWTGGSPTQHSVSEISICMQVGITIPWALCLQGKVGISESYQSLLGAEPEDQE